VGGVGAVSPTLVHAGAIHELPLLQYVKNMCMRKTGTLNS
jgi:hypothetical protein